MCRVIEYYVSISYLELSTQKRATPEKYKQQQCTKFITRKRYTPLYIMLLLM